MKEYLNSFTLELETLSPMHIGDGDCYEKKSYLTEGDELYVFRGKNLYRFLTSRYPHSDYERFVTDPRRDLRQFFQEYRIRKEAYEEAMERKLKIASNDGMIDSKIFTFVRDPYGCPYIPGSSLKGALRSVIESSIILQANNKPFTKDKMMRIIDDEREQYAAKHQNKPLNPKDKSFLRKVNENLSKDTMRAPVFLDKSGKYNVDDIVNDIMRGIIVGDSEPLSDSDILVNSIFSIGPDNIPYKKVQVIAECLKPHTVVRFPVTIDKSFYDKLTEDQKKVFTPEGILEAVKLCWDNYCQKYINKYSDLSKNETGSILMLGKYTGFVSKTEEIALFDGKDAMQVTSEVLKTRPSDRSPFFVRCSYVGDELYQMGRCVLSIRL